MSTNVLRVGDPQLLQAADDNNCVFWQQFGEITQSCYPWTERFAGYISGVRHPLYNGIVRCTCGGDEFTENLTWWTETLQSEELPAVWWVPPGPEQERLGSVLLERGWRLVIKEPAMAVALSSPLEHPILHNQLQVYGVSGEAARRQWAELLCLGIDLDATTTADAVALEAQLSDERNRFLGYWDGVPVATAANVLHAGVAGIYAVSTLPAYRGRGIGSAITLYAMEAARQRGYATAVLTSTEMGFPVYKKLGFEVQGYYQVYARE